MTSLNYLRKSTIVYRPDIDGLRALAVISVLFFHFFPSKLPGGYVGVDIFFVISGYLITSIIIKGISESTFNFWEFCLRRVRRIFPVLILVICVSGILGYQLLLPNDFTSFYREIIAGSLFFYNFSMAKATGYFDGLAEEKPLLHLWSLGIEEQFYIVWPLLLILFYR